MVDLRADVVHAFPFRQGHHTGAAAAADRFERVIRDQQLPDLLVLVTFHTDCGFFIPKVFDFIAAGSLWLFPGIPSTARLFSSFSVYAFLRMQEGHDNTASLPHGGWQVIPQAHQFLAAIQWFIVDTFGPALGNGSFMYRALAFIRSRLVRGHPLLNAPFPL